MLLSIEWCGNVTVTLLCSSIQILKKYSFIQLLVEANDYEVWCWLRCIYHTASLAGISTGSGGIFNSKGQTSLVNLKIWKLFWPREQKKW